MIAVGHNVPLDELVVVAPQCRNGEVKYTDRRYSDSGPVDVGPYSAPIFDVFEGSEEYQTVLALFGLSDATSAAVTWYTRSEIFAWKRYNGIAIQPEPGPDGSWTNFFPRGFTIYIHSLIALEEP